MEEDVKKFSVKFIETTGRWADLELFNEDDAWAFMAELLDEYVRGGKRLVDGQIMALRNLGAALSLKPAAPLHGYVPALLRNFGPSPLSDEDLAELTRWVYAQVNGGFEAAKKAPVALNAAFPARRRRR